MYMYTKMSVYSHCKQCYCFRQQPAN